MNRIWNRICGGLASLGKYAFTVLALALFIAARAIDPLMSAHAFMFAAG